MKRVCDTFKKPVSIQNEYKIPRLKEVAFHGAARGRAERHAALVSQKSIHLVNDPLCVNVCVHANTHEYACAHANTNARVCVYGVEFHLHTTASHISFEGDSAARQPRGESHVRTECF